MKKYLLTGALITITATTLSATTAGSIVIDKMKAAAHAFTLATSLNPTDTGLTSDPVKGKKTGDILTAGEYNRLLELVSEGGGTGGSLQISFKKDYSKDGNSSVPTTENIGSHDFCALTRYGEGVTSDGTAGYCKVEKGTDSTWTVSIQALNNNINCQVTCFTGGGGSGGTPSTCPSGFVAVGSYCIEPTMNATGKDWYEAALACTEKGAQLCHWSEWSAACQKGVLTDVVFGASGKYEWIDDYSIANQGIADPIVYSNCKYLSRQADGTKAANTAYRCCAPKQ